MNINSLNVNTKVNLEQQAVILHSDGPLLVIAGPGSGKTFTLVERTVYLITNKNIRPDNIFIATFTEKAAKELITRISNRLLEKGIVFNINEMYIGTIHSICLRMLEEYREFTRLKRNYSLMDQFDQQYFIYQHMNQFEDLIDLSLLPSGGGRQSRWSKSEHLLKWINKISEEAIDPKLLKKDCNPSINALANAYKLYQRLLDEMNALDFSTIQLETLQMLENNSHVVEELQNKIKYMMIDEYQDTNTIQEAILLKIAGTKGNLCVVGDDDQGLYRFRGATIRNILEFAQKFPQGKCDVKKLTTNYRSHPGIVDFYNNWMKRLNWQEGKISFRYDKKMKSHNGQFFDGPSVLRVSGDSAEENWHEEVLEFLLCLKERILTDWNQVAFLFRSVRNDKVVALAEYLEENGIPVYSPRSNIYFERIEVKLVVGALLFLFPKYGKIRQWDSNVSLSIWGYYDDCLRYFASMLRQPENKSLLVWCRERAKRHENLTKNLDYGFSSLYYQLFQFPLFAHFLADDISGTILDERPVRNLAQFSQLLVKFEYLHHIAVLTPKYFEKNLLDLFNQFFRYLRDGGINEYEDESEYAPKGCVSFLTVHQSKGLEFPIVFVGSLEGVPRKQHNDIDVILQETYYRKKPFEPIDRTKEFDFWRLYYTAFSRAQNFLVLTCQENVAAGRGQRNVPSRYFTPIYKELPKWRSQNFDSDITLAHIKDVNIKREYSFTSDIIIYETCPRQYRFYKELAFAPVRQSPILFGTLVHQTIEDIHNAILRDEREIICEKQVTDWFNLNYNNLSKKERVYLAPSVKDIALEHVIRYMDNSKGEWDRIREAEVDVSLVKDQYILKGTIDLIKGENNTVEIVDFKSEKKPNLFSEKEKVERYKRQLEIYAHVVEERFGIEVSRMHLYYTGEENGSSTITFKKSTKSIASTIQAIDQTVTKIEQKNFTISEKPVKYCEDCDIRHYCNL